MEPSLPMEVQISLMLIRTWPDSINPCNSPNSSALLPVLTSRSAEAQPASLIMAVRGCILPGQLRDRKTLRTCKLFSNWTTMPNLSQMMRIRSWRTNLSRSHQCLQHLGYVRKNWDIRPKGIPKIIYPCGSLRTSQANKHRYRKMTSLWALLVLSYYTYSPPILGWHLNQGISRNALAFRASRINVRKSLLNWLKSRR